VCPDMESAASGGESSSSASSSFSSSSAACITPESIGLPACGGSASGSSPGTKYALICQDGCLSWMPIDSCDESSSPSA
jgi:hypothetical protein